MLFVSGNKCHIVVFAVECCLSLSACVRVRIQYIQVAPAVVHCISICAYIYCIGKCVYIYTEYLCAYIYIQVAPAVVHCISICVYI